MVPVLEAVPNISEGRDPARVEAWTRVVAGEGVEVLDVSSDPDHHRSVITYVGEPRAVERASLALAREVVETVDLRGHRGVHPRVGALDVLPFVPLSGLTLADAARSAHRVGKALCEELGLPVYFYGAASDPPGRRLAEVRRGGFEALAQGFPEGRAPDLAPAGVRAAHPTAGVTCVGARAVLLAWNVYVEGVGHEALRALAARLRETGGGFSGLRALAFRLQIQDRVQLSMNLEDLEGAPPFDVFAAVEGEVEALGGRVSATEIIGMMPDALVLPAAADRLRLLDAHPSRLLSSRLAHHLSTRVAPGVAELVEAVREAGDAVPEPVRAAARRLAPSPPPAREP
ncbi:MAG: glutamate formimidoyltransferase [Gemmatimonadetes bacterium]|nr:glutamate formimidoyltransferase [Gemmatimonadota bacterium]